MYSNVHIEPKNMTVLCTYQCTAACKQCCFESSPHIKGRLSGDVLRKRITEAHQALPSIKVGVFSGGEEFTLYDELINSCEHDSSMRLEERRVGKKGVCT